MTDINSIIEMIESVKLNMNSDMIYSKRAGYQLACDDIIEQLRTMSDWMPIETAPKDEKCLIVINDQVYFGYWRDDKYAKTPRPYWGGEFETIWGTREARLNKPTQWMPLPKPQIAKNCKAANTLQD